MIALSCREILMGQHSSLGPIDPQFSGLAAHGVLEEFRRAALEIRQDPAMANLWAPVLGKYPPSFIVECENALQWAKDITRDWLASGMFAGLPDAVDKAEAVVTYFADHMATKSHNRHIERGLALQQGLSVAPFDGPGNDELQEAVLSVHHATIHTLTSTAAYKIVENHDGIAFIQAAGELLVRPTT